MWNCVNGDASMCALTFFLLLLTASVVCKRSLVALLCVSVILYLRIVVGSGFCFHSLDRRLPSNWNFGGVPFAVCIHLMFMCSCFIPFYCFPMMETKEALSTFWTFWSHLILCFVHLSDGNCFSDYFLLYAKWIQISLFSSNWQNQTFGYVFRSFCSIELNNWVLFLSFVRYFSPKLQICRTHFACSSHYLFKWWVTTVKQQTGKNMNFFAF